ncbi:MAG: hypothetical protein M3403_08310 [Gemmatimonadota bacterium]|nr:hypothetical protein [Gemmatimonadota bacterium]
MLNNPINRFHRDMASICALLVVAIIGCHGLTSPGLDRTYVLSSVNGQPLPATISRDNITLIEIVDGSLTFKEDRTFSAHSTLRVTKNGVATSQKSESSGSYILEGTILTLKNAQTGEVTRSVTEGDGRLIRHVSNLENSYLYEMPTVIN